VVGKVFLADNIAVAAHSLVTKSFYEEDITIGGVPAKKLRDGGRSVWDTKKVQEETK
jgi:serine O-acetyltransferase